MSRKALSESGRDKANTNWTRYQYARERGHEKFVAKHDQCNNFFFSEQWKDEDKAKLTRAGRPALTINRIKPVIKDMTGEFINYRADVKFVPSAGGEPEIADALTKLYLHISNEQDLSDKELDLWLDGVISSRAYYDIRIGFDDNLQGEVRVSVPNPKNVIPDPDSDSKDPRNWNEVLLSNHLTIQDIELFYGREKARQLKKHPNVDTDFEMDELHRDTFAGPDFTTHHSTHGAGDEQTQRLYHVIERQYKRIEKVPHFVDTATGDTRRIPRNWDDGDIAEILEAYENIEVQKLNAQVIRWTVSCGSVLLHDDISPYDEFTIIPWFPIFRRGRSSGVVEDLIDPQLNYNKQRSQELHIVNGTANAGWKVKRGSLLNMDIEDLEAEGAKTGIVLEFAESPDEIERIQPVNIPQGVDRISEKAERDLKSISGIDDEARGVARGNTPGKAIEARREAALVSMGPMFASLAWTRRRLAKRILKLVQKFYTEERHLRIIGNPIRGDVEDVALNEPQDDGTILNDLTIGEYDVVITPAPQRDSYEQMQFEQLKEMQTELEINIPAHLFVEFSDLGRKTEIVDEILRVNGMAEPSEEEQQIQQMERELEMEEKRAAIEARMAQAQLSRARAQKVLHEIEQAGNDPEKIDKLLLEAQKLDNERYRDEQSMAIRQRAQAAQEAKLIADYDVKERELDQQQLELELKAREAERAPQAAQPQRNQQTAGGSE